MAALLAVIIGFALIAGVMFVTAAWRGYVLSVVWGWLVVPIFHLAPITIIGAVTLSLIVGFLTQHATSTEEQPVGQTLMMAFIYPLIVLIFAFFAKGFI